MRKILRIVVAFVASVLAAGIAASIFSTQFVIAGLQNIGVEIPLATRLSMTFGDLAILQTMAAVILACFLVGFLVAALCRYKLGGSRLLWYVAAGSISLVAALLLLSNVMELMPVAGARTSFGMITQGLAGAIGGFVFTFLSKPRLPVEVAHA